MLFFTHIIFSVLIFILFFDFNILNFFVTLFGTMFVDIDSATSFLGKKFKIVSFLFGHRKFFHSIFSALFFSLLIYLVNTTLAMFFFIGYMSHLFMDSLTKKGIKLFYPLNYSIKGFIKVGGILEYILFFVMLCLIIITLI